MSKSRAFAFNPSLEPPVGATQFGNVCVETSGWFMNTGGLKWYNGPDEDLGYVICHLDTIPKTAGSYSEIISATSIGFWRTTSKTEPLFLELVSTTTGQIFASGSQARSWLHNNGYWTSYSVYSVTSGTKNPVLGNGTQITFPESGWTSLVSGNEDDNYRQVNLPFIWTFNGTGYTSFFPSSNSYITFGNGSSQYSGLAPNSPPYDKIFFAGSDNSWQQVSTIESDDKYVRLRYEGTNSTGGAPGSPNIVYELTFFNPIYTNGENWIELLVGNQDRLGAISGIYGPNSQLSGGQMVPSDTSISSFESYVLVGDSTGTNWTVYTGSYVDGTDY